jgi:hypothetical protein
MSQWAGGVLTAAGRALQAKVEAGTTLNITKVKLGDGTESMSQVDSLTNLVSPKVELAVSTAEVEGETCTITGIMASTALNAGFYCREWGLFAQDPDVGEILYMITIDSQPEWLPASTESATVSATYAMNIAVANSTSITANIDLAGLVDVDMLNKATHAVQRSTSYVAGQLATAATLPSGLLLKCSTGGTTGTTLIDWSQYNIGDTINDGTVVWLVTQYAVSDGDAFYIGSDGNWTPNSAAHIYSANWVDGSDGNLYPVS